MFVSKKILGLGGGSHSHSRSAYGQVKRNGVCVKEDFSRCGGSSHSHSHSCPDGQVKRNGVCVKEDLLQEKNIYNKPYYQ